MPYFGLLTVIGVGAVMIIAALSGDLRGVWFGALVIAARLLLTIKVPLVWSGNITRSLEASRKVASQ
jgi:hypothetical protein